VNLIIDSSLSEPPSEISCFRDVTLYGKVFIFEDILVQCPTGTRSMYWKWLKQYGAHDFVSQLIKEDEFEPGFSLRCKRGNITIDRLTAFNLSQVISVLNGLKRN
jgi:hypothetical protein